MPRRGRGMPTLTAFMSNPTNFLEITIANVSQQEVQRRLRASVLKNCKTLDVDVGQESSQRSIEQLAESLRCNTSIKVLIIRGTLGAGGAATICDSLSGNTSVNALNMNGCGIGDEGATALAGTLLQNRSITACDVARNGITAVGTRVIGEAMAENTTLLCLGLQGNPGSFLASSKNHARRMLNSIDGQCRWNYVLPIVRNHVNEFRMQVVLILCRHRISQDLATRILELSGNEYVSSKSLPQYRRSILIEELEGVKAKYSDEEGRRLLLANCNPESAAESVLGWFIDSKMTADDYLLRSHAQQRIG